MKSYLVVVGALLFVISSFSLHKCSLKSIVFSDSNVENIDLIWLDKALDPLYGFIPSFFVLLYVFLEAMWRDSMPAIILGPCGNHLFF